MGLADHAETTPDKVAVVDGATGASLTWRELVGRARATARDWALAPGSRVAVMLPNGLDLTVAQCATALGRLELVPVNWHLKHDEVAHVLDDSGAALLVTTPELARHAPTGIAVALSVSEDIGEALADEWPTPSWVFYTSGTTGRPKGVVHGRTDPAIAGQLAERLAALWGITGDDVYLLGGPGYHAGPAGYANTTLFKGGTVVAMPAWDAAAAWRLMADHDVTCTFLAPAQMIRLLEVDPHPMPRAMRLVIHAGAPCPVDVKRRFLDALPGVEVSELYGASEGGATKITRADWLARPGSVGQPWPGVTIEIRDGAGAVLPAGQDGIVWVQPALGQRFRYHNDEAKTDESWQRDFFSVGDIGHLDDDGYLYLTDRANDMVIWSGVNIYPREIEDVLHAHPAVVDCAVLGVPHERDGEQLLAVVEAPGASADDLAAHVRQHLADFKVPQHWDLVATLPRDPNGKVAKRHLRDAWLNR